MRRFLLRSSNGDDKCYEGILWSNGCVNINIAPEAYRTHFHSLAEFRAVHTADIEWLDERKQPQTTEQVLRGLRDSLAEHIIIREQSVPHEEIQTYLLLKILEGIDGIEHELSTMNPLYQ